MTKILLDIAPVLLLFPMGLLLKWTKVFAKEHADFMLKFVFYLSLPALILISIPKIEFTLELAFLPVFSAAVILSMFVISVLISKFLKVSKQTKGVFITGIMILNLGFVIPFVLAGFGEEGFARLSLFDFTNGFLAYSLGYYIALKHSDKNYSGKSMLRKFAASVPLWALLIALIFNLTRFQPGEVVLSFLQIIADTAIPLIMIALGIYFNLKFHKFKIAILGVTIRMGIGFLIGFSTCEIFDIQDITRNVILMASSAPIGFNAIIFSTLFDLDNQLAASMISISILFGLALMTLLIMV